MPARALEELRKRHKIAMAVTPGCGGLARRIAVGILRLWRAPDPLRQTARRYSIPVRSVASNTDSRWGRLLRTAQPARRQSPCVIFCKT